MYTSNNLGFAIQTASRTFIPKKIKHNLALDPGITKRGNVPGHTQIGPFLIIIIIYNKTIA